MSLYADYLSEYSGDRIIEDQYGFATYRILNEKQAYLIDIYVIPSMRGENRARYMAELVCMMAKNLECTELLGSVCTAAKDPTTSMKVILAYGMKFSHIEGNLIVFKKELR